MKTNDKFGSNDFYMIGVIVVMAILWIVALIFIWKDDRESKQSKSTVSVFVTILALVIAIGMIEPSMLKYLIVV